MKNGEALVQETNGRIKFSINAAYGQNVGEVAGEVPPTGDTANDVDRDGDCVLSFKQPGSSTSRRMGPAEWASMFQALSA
jgi:hypothetical protein